MTLRNFGSGPQAGRFHLDGEKFGRGLQRVAHDGVISVVDNLARRADITEMGLRRGRLLAVWSLRDDLLFPFCLRTFAENFRRSSQMVVGSPVVLSPTEELSVLHLAVIKIGDFGRYDEIAARDAGKAAGDTD